jgi:hypothetical protein
MTRDRLLLAAVGAVLLVVGLWPHRDRPTLAVTLVVAGAVLAALGALLPYVRNIQGEVGGFSLQLALVQLPAPLSTEPLGTLRGEVLPDSGSRAFSVLLRHPAPIAYSVVSLGDGQEWLTSRLLVFAVVLQELRDARCFVFTKRVGESGPDQFVGTVQPDDLRRCFAWRYPWLTAAMAQAWEKIVANQAGPDRPRLSAETADLLLQQTSQLLVQQNQAGPSGNPEWASVRGRLEHARWVNDSTLADALGSHLNLRRIAASSVSDVTPAAVMAVGGQFVALVDHDNRFVALLDRIALIEAEATRKAGS